MKMEKKGTSSPEKIKILYENNAFSKVKQILLENYKDEEVTLRFQYSPEKSIKELYKEYRTSVGSESDIAELLKKEDKNSVSGIEIGVTNLDTFLVHYLIVNMGS